MMKKIRYGYVLGVCLALLLLCALCAGCAEKDDPLMSTSFEWVRVKGDGNLEALVTLDATGVAEHKGQYAYLYEIYPGETLQDIQGRSSVASAEIASAMRFSIPLMDGERTRLYSTFAVCYSGGSLILSATKGVENPRALASVSNGYLWKDDPKGLAVTDVAEALSLKAPHVSVEVSVKALLSFLDVPFSFQGTEYAVSSSVIGATDARVKEASAAGAQVSLRIVLDGEQDIPTQNAILDFLARRYNGGELGTVSAWLLDPAEQNMKETAMLTSVAHKALLSRVGDGRIYVMCDKKTLDGVTLFFEELSSLLARTGSFDWGAALVPSLFEGELWDGRDTDLISAKNLSQISYLLKKEKNAPRYLALCDVLVGGKDEGLRAVSYAYLYAKASAAKFDLILYGAQRNDTVGLFSSTGERRAMAEMFANIDGGLTHEQIYLCKTYGAAVWDTVSSLSPTRITLTGVGSMGASGGRETTILDFSKGDTYGFSSVGGTEAPVIRDSAALSKPVLYTLLDAKREQTGVVGIVNDPSALFGASSLSVHLLAQYAAAKEYTLTLRLEGVAKSGELLIYEAEARAVSGSWQTVSFYIDSFASRADLSSPCVITLLSEPAGESEEHFALWISEIFASSQAQDLSFLIPVALAGGGIGFGFLLFALIYRVSNKRKYVEKKTQRQGGSSL